MQRSVKFEYKFKNSKFYINLLFYMRTGFVVLAGLLALQSQAGGLKLDSAGCKLAQKVQREQIQCSCAGGSGDYDWHFESLPDKWRSEKGRLFSENGKFEERKVFGTKVEVIDRVSRQSARRSLFFTVENGRIKKAADHDFDFDVSNLVDDRRQIIGGGRGSDDDDRVKRVFDDADAIGGGCGLKKLRPYFGGRGLYQGDDRNPFRDRLPSFQEVDQTIQSGRSKDIRELIVNTVRSKLGCRDVGGFLEKVFQRVRGKIGQVKDELESTRKTTETTKGQLEFLGDSLKKTQSQAANVKELLAQLQKLKLDSIKIQQDREKLKVSLQQANEQIEIFQAEIARNVESVRRIKEDQELKSKLISKIDSQIAELQVRIKELNDRKDKIGKESEANRVLISEVDNKNKNIQVKVDALRIAVNEIRQKLKTANTNWEAVELQIQEAQKSIRLADNQERNEQIKQQVNVLRESLTTSRNREFRVGPAFKDLAENYDDIERIRDHHFNRCYKTYFNDDRDQFREDDDDGVEFFGRDEFDKYLEKVHGRNRKRQNINIRPVDNKGSIVVNNQVKNSNSGQEIISKSLEGKNDSRGVETRQRYRMKRTHIFSPQWSKAFGSVYDDNFDEKRGRRFVQNDFQCDIGNIVNLGSFNGKVVSVNKNVAKVTNDKGEQCTLYLGGCTRVETVNKPLPQPGDEIYWKGTWRNGRQYNAHHVTCI